MIFTKAFSWELRKTACRVSDLGLYSLAKESDLTPSMFLTDTVIVSCDSILRDKGAVSAPCLNFSSMLSSHVTRQSPTQLLMLCGLSSMSYGVTGPLQCSFGLSWLQKISNFFFQPLASEDFSGNYKPWMTGTGQGERRCWPPSIFGVKLGTTREETECLQLISVLMQLCQWWSWAPISLHPTLWA